MTQGWLILQLTDSPFWVGLSAGIRGLSLTITGVAGGVIADRVENVPWAQHATEDEHRRIGAIAFGVGLRDLERRRQEDTTVPEEA